MKKILLVSHEMTYTGAPRSLLQMAKILNEAKYCVSVWTLKSGEFEEEFQKLGIEVRFMDFPNTVSDKLAQELKGFQIVIANTIFTASFAQYAQRFTKTILYIREAQNIPQLIEACNLSESSILNISNIVCVSEYAKEFIRRRYQRENITVIHNYVEDKLREKNKYKNLVNSKRNNQEINFLVSGTLEPRKGQDIAINAFKELIEEGKKGYLHLVGAMPEWAADYQKSLDLSSEKKIIYHGEIRDRIKLLELYEKMDVVLIPSTDESCSLVTLEAAMLEKAIILTENVGAKYLVDSSCVIPVGDSKRLKEKMYEYICKPNKIREDGQSNRKNYLKKATENQYTSNLLKYIKKIEQQSFCALNEDGVKVSIIVPVYNMEKYLIICMNSLIAQTLSDIEIICVNDGSTDDSLSILEKYKEKDSRVKIICTSNMGYGHAMNVGIKEAVGEYIGIVEPDDYVDAKMYEILYHRAIALDVDIIKADFYRFIGENDKQENVYFMTARAIENYGRVICPKKEKDCFRYFMNTWTGIYRRDFIESNQIYHNESLGASYQDNGFWFQSFCYAKRIAFVNKALYYNRRDNPNSSVNSKEKVYSANEEFLFIRNFLKNNPDLESEFLYQFSLKKYHTYLFTLERIAWKYKREYLRSISKEFCEAEKNGELCQSVFTPQEWFDLNWIMRDDAKYYEKVVKGEINDDIEYYKYCLDEIKNSKSYKIGRAITWLPRKIRGW